MLDLWPSPISTQQNVISAICPGLHFHISFKYFVGWHFKHSLIFKTFFSLAVTYWLATICRYCRIFFCQSSYKSCKEGYYFISAKDKKTNLKQHEFAQTHWKTGSGMNWSMFCRPHEALDTGLIHSAELTQEKFHSELLFSIFASAINFSKAGMLFSMTVPLSVIEDCDP